MTARARPGFIAIYRNHHRHTRSLAPLGHAIARFAQAALANFVQSREQQADREIARVLRARPERLAQLPCNSAALDLNLGALQRV